MKEGVQVPFITWPIRVRDESIGGTNPFRWDTLDSEEVFMNKRVVIFSLPGAFTPTCSTYQLPGFEDHYWTIRKDLGIDEIYVVSVNDTFVMRKWLETQYIKKVKFIPDGNGEFTRQLGMLVDKCNLGFGMRSWRYAAVVNDGKIEKWFEEPGIMDQCEEDPYGETSPENVMAYLQSTAES